MIDSRPLADESQVELAMFRFPHRELDVDEYAARFEHTIERTAFSEYTRYRYPDQELDRWIERLRQLLQSPSELDRLKRERLGTSVIEYRLLKIGLCNESTGFLTWQVLNDETVRAGQPLLEFETKMAVFNLLCPRTGVAKWLRAEETEICLGQPLICIDPSGCVHELADPQRGDKWWCPTNGTHTCEGWPHLRKLMEYETLAEQ